MSSKEHWLPLSEAAKASRRNRYANNREEISEDHKHYQKDWRILNPLSNWYSKVKYRYGLNKKQADFLRTKPSCEICGRSVEKMCVDHNHTTSQVRGWLCDECNNGIGRFKDSPDLLHKAINYLEKVVPVNIQELEKLK